MCNRYAASFPSVEDQDKSFAKDARDCHFLASSWPGPSRLSLPPMPAISSQRTNRLARGHPRIKAYAVAPLNLQIRLNLRNTFLPICFTVKPCPCLSLLCWRTRSRSEACSGPISGPSIVRILVISSGYATKTCSQSSGSCLSCTSQGFGVCSIGAASRGSSRV